MNQSRTGGRHRKPPIAMSLEFKHFIYLLALGCVVWAIAVSAVVAYDDVSESVAIKGELTYDRGASFFESLDKLKVVEQVLNIVLPLALLCIGYLAYTYRINPIGLGSITVVVLAFLFAADSILDAKDSVERDYEVKLASMVWWMGD